MKNKIRFITIVIFGIVSQSCVNNLSKTNIIATPTSTASLKPTVNPSPVINVNVSPSEPIIDFSNTNNKILIYKNSLNYDNIPAVVSKIDNNGNGLILYRNMYRKVENFKISDNEDALYNPTNQDSYFKNINYSHKTLINSKGDGFIIFSFPGESCISGDIGWAFSCSKGLISYVKIKNYKVISEPKQDIFDEISVDENGNGIIYTYSNSIQISDPILLTQKRSNSITFRRINQFEISDKEEIIEKLNNLSKEYIIPHVILSPTGNGTNFYFDYSDNVVSLYIKKITNFISEKDYINIGKFNSEQYLGVFKNKNYYPYIKDIYTLDNNGNGYIHFIIKDQKTQIVPIKNYFIQNDKSFVVDNINYPSELDTNGNGYNAYVEKNFDNKFDLKIQKITNYTNIETKTTKNFPINDLDNFLGYYLKDGKGYVLWKEKTNTSSSDLSLSDELIYFKYIN